MQVIVNLGPSRQHKSQPGLSDTEGTVTMTTSPVTAMNGQRRGLREWMDGSEEHVGQI